MRVGFVAGLAALVAVVMLMADGAASARKKLAAPAAPDANSTSLSPSALGMDERDTTDTKPDIKIPDSIKFGDHTLHFDAAGKTVDPTPRVGLDATDPHVLPMQKDQELPPAYFGLKLTTPMR